METQETVSKWAIETFGRPTPLRAALRTNTELAELLVALYLDNKEQIAKELADVAICLFGVATTLDEHLRTLPAGRVAPRCELIQVILRRWNDLLQDVYLGLGYGHVQLIWRALGDLAACCEVDMQNEIDRKMAINRARRWKLDGSGCGQHEE